ncbi:MAG: alanine dehydrogenase [Betaproteobacteria bacterium RIFCSPLOWO2_12_FULL_65_110]|nr:MAG: alanine dehydrogenase [Betaproteobacteria bacterium RIFCSPLOWO2_12_FULL_65_110]
MLVGVPREIKNHESRVGLTPQSVRELAARGHTVLVERDAGAGIAATDGEYRSAGAAVVDTAEEVFARAELIVKVKEPQQAERRKLRAGQVLFAYLHLAPDPEQAKDLVASGAIAIAYETVTSEKGGLPLLAPMSEVAGRMSVQVAAHFLERPQGGRGVLMSGATGIAPASVTVLGAGIVGSNAAMVAAGMGAEVAVLDPSLEQLRRLVARLGSRVRTKVLTPEAVGEAVRGADAVIGAALIPGALAPRLVTRAMLATLREGAVLVDVSIDQGGCFETSRPTTHAAPTYVVDGIVHYCVANMPGAVPRTSTYALNNATLPFVLALADQGWRSALQRDRHLRNGLNICRGRVTNREVAEALGGALGMERSDPDAAIA